MYKILYLPINRKIKIMTIQNNTHNLSLRKTAKVVNALLTGALSLSVLSFNAAATTLWQTMLVVNIQT